MIANTTLFVRGLRWFAILAAGSFILVTGCGPRRQATRTFLCRIDAGSMIQYSLIVSGDRRHLMYAEGDNKRQRMVVDGKAGPFYDGILARTLALSRDGKRYAYGAGRGKRRFIVLDGVPQPPGDGIREGTPVFSPDGGRIAWGELRDLFWSMVVDGREGWKFDELWPPVFSSDGKHLAYIARTGPKKAVVVDSILQSQHDNVDERSLAFGTDGRVTYRAIDKGISCFIRGGRPASPDSGNTHQRDRTEVRKVGSVTVGLSVVHDTITGPVYNEIAGLAYSADSARFGYIARTGADWFAVIDGKPGKSHPFIFKNSLAFSADGKHALFASKAGNTRFVVLDDRPGKGYDLIFAEDDRPVVVDSEQSFHYLALKGDSVFVVEERIR